MPSAKRTSRFLGRLTRRVVLGVVIAGLVVGGALLIGGPRLFRRVPMPTLTFDAESYVGSQLLGIVNSHLRPEFAFDSITYEAPGTARLAGVSLTDPGGVRIIEAGGMTVTLAEAPRKDRPIKIERLAMADGVVRLTGDGAGGLIGFSRMTDRGGKDDINESFRLSNVLVLNRVELDNISIEYREDEAADPVRLDRIASAMDVQPDGEHGPGWYAVAFESGRAPGFELEVSGRLNLDTFDAEIGSLGAGIDADPDTIGSLPGPLASLLERHEVRGRLEATGRATLNVRRPLDAGAELSVRGQSLHFAVGEYQAQADSLRIDAGLSEGVLTVDPLEVNLLGGALRCEGRVEASAAGRPARGVCTIEGVNLREALRRAPGDGPPRLAGILSGRVEASTLLGSPRASLQGAGDAAVKDGRLLLLPGLTQLSNLINNGGVKDTGASNHRGTASFTLGPGGATITESEVVTNTLAARGTGLVGFDRTLDLRVNAGPLEKIQSLLGVVGDLLGKVTDQLVKYTIKGTIDEPEVGIAPLGID